MRILMLCWEFPPRIHGGLGVACDGLATALGQAGHDVTVLVPFAVSAAPGPVRVISAADVLQQSLFTPWDPYRGVYEYSVAGSARSLAVRRHGDAGDLRQSSRQGGAESLYGPGLPVAVTHFERAARRLVRREAFDIVHCHDWMTIPAGMGAREGEGIPWIYHVHSLETDRAGTLANRYILNVEDCGIRRAHRLVCVSAAQRSRLVESRGIDPDRVGVVHNAVPADIGPVAGTDSGAPGYNVLFLARITWQKAPDLFLKAAARVAAELEGVTFCVAGDGELLESMIHEAARVGLSRCMQFAGFVERSRVPELLNAADVLVMTSVNEPFGLTALEAAVAGVPVVIPRNAGACEVLTAAATFEPGDVTGLARQTVRALTDRAWRRQAAQCNRQDALNWSWNDAAEAVVENYRNAMTFRKDGQHVEIRKDHSV